MLFLRCLFFRSPNLCLSMFSMQIYCPIRLEVLDVLENEKKLWYCSIPFDADTSS